MGDAHRAVGRVDALSAWPARTEDVNPEVLVLQLDVNVLGFRQHGHGGRGRVDPAGRLGDGDPLHPVHPRLAPQVAVGVPAHRDDRLTDAVEIPRGDRNRLHLQAPALGVARVHAQQLRGEQRRLVATRARPDLDDGVPVVQRVARRQQVGELRLESRHLRHQRVHLLARQRGELRLRATGELAGRRQIGGQLQVPPSRAHDGLEPGVLLPQSFELGGIPGRQGAGSLGGYPFRPLERSPDAAPEISLRTCSGTWHGTARRGPRCPPASAFR